MSFKPADPETFDRVKAQSVRDEHDFLESRFFDRDNNVIAKVVRHQDEDGNLKPAAELLVAD